MKLKEKSLKWLTRFYPPLFFHRIWVEAIGPKFYEARVKIRKSIWNKNPNDSIFGGTIFSAADPFFVLLISQHFLHKGYTIKGWVKSGTIQYIKPAFTSITLRFVVTEQEMNDAEQQILAFGRYTGRHEVEAKNMQGEVCALVSMEVYIRDMNFRTHEH